MALVGGWLVLLQATVERLPITGVRDAEQILVQGPFIEAGLYITH